MVFGKKYVDEDLDNRGFKAIGKEVEHLAATPNLGDFFPFLGAIDLQGLTRRLKDLSKVLDEFLEKIIDEHAQSHGQKQSTDFVDTMLDIMQSGEAKFQFDRSHIKAILLIQSSLLKQKASLVLLSEAWKLSRLRKKCIESGFLCFQPSRVEIIAALLWMAFIRTSAAINGYLRPCLMDFPLNLRSKTSLPKVHNSMGNFRIDVPIKFTPEKTNMELHSIVILIRDTVNRIVASCAKASPDEIVSTLVNIYNESVRPPEWGGSTEVDKKGSQDFMVWDVRHGQGPGLGRDKLGIRARFMVPGSMIIVHVHVYDRESRALPIRESTALPVLK
ncbi:hypothetical protein T459_24606 [Capsicum annuum]|uniref:Uncharacterized protein n=1 Tax=Capsicum annuum TaxID=4072 RepID=A0A2G2YIC3_CAPAN|nr:hypothetical protein T459_24606 [Capsicum annuum]